MCRRRNGEYQIFECSIFQNIVENMILYFEMTDDEIVSFYKKPRTVIGDREFRICYLDVENVAEKIDIGESNNEDRCDI